MPPPLGSPAPLPPPTNHAQGDENKEECRGLGDLLGAATDDRSDEGVDVEAVDDLVVVRHARYRVCPVEPAVHLRKIFRAAASMSDESTKLTTLGQRLNFWRAQSCRPAGTIMMNGI